MGVQCVLVVLLMFAGTVKAEEVKGGVTFWRETVTLTCPGNGEWFGSTKLNATGETYQYQYTSKGTYSCVYRATDNNDDPKYRYKFYVEGNVCKNCFELDAIVFGVAIIIDLTFTSVLMIVIYKCTKKNNPAAPSHSANKAPTRPGARPPPVPSADYEPLNPNTRSQDTYSMVNRTG